MYFSFLLWLENSLCAKKWRKFAKRVGCEERREEKKKREEGSKKEEEKGDVGRSTRVARTATVRYQGEV